jgi:hypothetical protein
MRAEDTLIKPALRCRFLDESRDSPPDLRLDLT